MALSDHMKPALTWDDAKPPQVSVAIVCHCGETFDIDSLDKAQAHIKAHEGEPGTEPS
jgi:hypothetical protein